MFQLIEMTDKQKMKMYKKLPKKKIIKMLLENQKIIDSFYSIKYKYTNDCGNTPQIIP